MQVNNIQACLFDISDCSTNDARKWLKNHNITPIKNVHKTDHYLRYRIKTPKYDLFHYRIKTIQTKPLINLILEYY